MKNIKKSLLNFKKPKARILNSSGYEQDVLNKCITAGYDSGWNQLQCNNFIVQVMASKSENKFYQIIFENFEVI